MITTEYPNAVPVVKPTASRTEIYQIGCGGTGSYLARAVAQIVLVAREAGTPTSLTLIDPDLIEARNIPRQQFATAELGQNKAEAVAARLNAAWGLDIEAIAAPFDPSMATLRADTLTVLVGAVDNARARRSIAAALAQGDGRRWWLDTGNSAETGQVLIGNTSRSKDLAGAFVISECCLKLPSPALVAPDLLVARPEESRRNRVSCAQLVAANLQSLTINQRVAAEAADMLFRFLIAGTLTRFGVYFDTASATSRGLYTSVDETARVTGVSAASLRGPVHRRKAATR